MALNRLVSMLTIEVGSLWMVFFYSQKSKMRATARLKTSCFWDAFRKLHRCGLTKTRKSGPHSKFQLSSMAPLILSPRILLIIKN
ncbi:hypothetical protein L3Y34_019571 [Caenorhabditis briggsae]|uniref:Uncharacterized protein n=1 Tax=Caenorhabditis briggsae TaxID=6238 RepID=A0AAE9DPB6_CAEBR|nr:hypothetical protein L3Y34_019571 [Caenorhabditis briggsae]